MELNKKFILIFVLVFVIVLSSSVFAGCFLDQDSPTFCLDVSLEEAQEECDLIDCDVLEVYSVNSCSENDLCETVLCKTTCSEQLRAECLEPLDENEFDAWCSPGCCFYGDSSDSCFYSINRWECLNNVRNFDERRYSYDVSLSPKECSNFCKDPKRAGLEFFSVEQVDFSSSGGVLGAEISGRDGEVVSSDDVVESEIVDEDEKEEVSYSLFFFLMFVFAAVGVGIYYFNYQRQRGILRVPDDEDEDSGSGFDSGSFLSRLNFSRSKKTQDHIKDIKKKHSHKLNQMRHNQEFVNFGLGLQKKDREKNVQTKKLKRLIVLKKLKLNEKNKKNEVKNVEQLSGILKKEKEELDKKIAFNRQMQEKKKKNLQAIDDLKKFSKK
jgi:hypothetical protein